MTDSSLVFGAMNYIEDWNDLVVNLSVDTRCHEFRYGRAMALPSAPERAPILRTLRVGLHVMFAVLLGLGLIRAFFPADGMTTLAMPHRLLTTILVVMLALVYVLGTSQEYRWYRHDTASSRQAASAQGSSTVSKVVVRSWLATITVLWLILLIFSPSFVWVAFPLMFLYLHLLSVVSGVIAVILLWAATWLLPWWDAVRVTGPQFPELATILGPGIGAVLAVLISAAYRHLLAQAVHHQRVATALQAAQADLAATEHQAGQLEERERLAREIHDTLAQGFSSIVLLTRAARQQPDVPETTQQTLDIMEDTAATNLTEARRFVQHLSASDPETSLTTALKQLSTRYETELALRDQPLEIMLRWEGEGSAADLPEPVTSTVLRAVQVGLGNVAAHAKATRVVITVGVWQQEVTVDIHDDGTGFTVPEAFQPRFAEAPPTQEMTGHTGYGLYGLQQRLTTLNGTLIVESAPGEGTVLAARIPLTAASQNATSQETS